MNNALNTTSLTPVAAPRYETREAWLTAFMDAARPHFEAVDAPLPSNIRVSVSMPGTSKRGRGVAGECWSTTASTDGHFEIFIRAIVETEARLADILTHELVHAAVGIDKGHGPAFGAVARALGLVGKLTATTAGPDWFAWAEPILMELGPIPYAAMTTDGFSSRKKKKTYLLKVECPDCGWLARVSASHIEPHPYLTCPVPDCAGVLITDPGNDTVE